MSNDTLTWLVMGAFGLTCFACGATVMNFVTMFRRKR